MDHQVLVLLQELQFSGQGVNADVDFAVLQSHNAGGSLQQGLEDDLVSNAGSVHALGVGAPVVLVLDVGAALALNPGLQLVLAGTDQPGLLVVGILVSFLALDDQGLGGQGGHQIVGVGGGLDDESQIVTGLNAGQQLQGAGLIGLVGVDVCVTSSNAVSIVKSLPNQNIFFIPDKNLGSFVAASVPEKNIILNDGYCPIHAAISACEVKEEMQKHPNALVLTHPECEADILALSDYIGSTAGIIAYAAESACEEFIICTEDGVEFKLVSDNPAKKFYFPKKRPCCTDMKRNTLENLLHVLKTEENEVIVGDDRRAAALVPLDRMLELAR